MGIHAVVIGLVGATLLIAAPARAASEVDPGIDAFVQQWESASRAIKSFPPNDKDRIAAACRKLTDESFDFDVMAHGTFADIWAKIPSAPRQSLALTLEKRAVSDCVDHIGEYGGGPLTLLGVRIADDGDRLATVDVRSAGGRNVHVAWRLRAPDTTRWKAVDLIVEGRSMRAGLRNEFNRILASRNGNVAAAVDMMGRR